jgi:hypothetical protein
MRWRRPAMPVLVDADAPWPGVPLSPRPPAAPGQPYEPPTGRGVARLSGRDGFGRCPICARSTQLRQDGTLISHKTGPERCAGSLLPPGDLPALASWLPLLAGLTEHGQRHAYQTMLDDLNFRYVLQADRMGHEVPGMRGVYKHIAPEWRVDLVNGLQRLWDESLASRAKFSVRVGRAAARWPASGLPEPRRRAYSLPFDSQNRILNEQRPRLCKERGR